MDLRLTREWPVDGWWRRQLTEQQRRDHAEGKRKGLNLHLSDVDTCVLFYMWQASFLHIQIFFPLLKICHLKFSFFFFLFLFLVTKQAHFEQKVQWGFMNDR